jgi:hypothetical protein
MDPNNPVQESGAMNFPAGHSKTQYIVSLAKELIDDIELSRIPIDALLLKTMRLARLAGSQETQTWIASEVVGYESTNPICIKYMGIMGRWTDYEKKLGYWFPLAQVEANIMTMKLRLQSLRVPDISYAPSNPNNWSIGDMGTVTAPVTAVLNEARSINDAIGKLSGIKSRVVGHLYNFSMQIYHEKIFSGLAESIFERYKNMVDARLSVQASDVLEKIPSIYNRLAEGDPESISHAQSTCRRIIDAFVDAIYPPTDVVIEQEGRQVPLNRQNTRARINQYIREKTDSESRRTKIRQTLTNLYDRVSTAVHADITLEEAQSLFLQTYLLLGEILTLGDPPQPAIKPPDALPSGTSDSSPA